jgi:hypothetical protein
VRSFLRGEQWRLDAACAGRGDLFWPPDPISTTKRLQLRAEAALVCESCPVREPCAAYAAEHQCIGLWAGQWRADRPNGEPRPHRRATPAGLPGS